MRLAFALAALFAAAAAHAGITFVTPQPGGQVVGPQLVEVATDIPGVDRVEFHVDGVLVGVARTAPYRIAYDFGTSLAARRVSAKVISNGFRSTEMAEIVTVALSAGETMHVDLVEVPMRARIARSLRPEDIRIRENGVEQIVRSVIPNRGPANFVFVVDRSLSMGGGRLAAALRAVDEARGQLRPGDTASLILFNHHVARPQPLTQASAGALASTAPSGGTSLRDAVASSIGSASERTYVIVITDGGDRNSLLSDEAALRKISGTRTVVSAVVLGRAGTFVEAATKNTGGTLLQANSGSLSDQVRRLLEDINSRYTVVYQSSGSARGWRSISISARRSGVDVLAARKGYFAE